MKKTAVVLGLATIIFAGGCAKEDKVTCTKKVDSSDYVQEQKMVVTVKDEKVSKMEMASNTKFSKASDEEINAGYDMLKNIYSSLDKDGIDVDVTKDKKNVKAVINIDFSKASEEDVKQFTESYSDGKNKKISTKEIKKQMEEDGYTCK